MSSSDDECPPLALPLEQQLTHDGAAEAVAPDGPAAEQAAIVERPAGPEPAVLPPVPVTLITGYLGAGKTTLVNYILTAKHGCRCAVLLNEIGDSADVERALVKEPEGADASPLTNWVEMENGCICCSAKNDMVKALEALMQQRERFDFLLIETTGLANPGPVAAALWTDEELESSVCLDAVVAVVDAKNIQRQLAEGPGSGGGGDGVNEAQQQLAFADVVLLNKVDLVGEEQAAAIAAGISSINTDAAVLPTTRCAVDLRHILNTGIYSGSLRGPRGEAGEAAAGPVAGHQAGAAAEAAGGPAAAGAAHEHAHDHSGSGGCAVLGCSGAGPAHQHHLPPEVQVRTVSLVEAGAPLQLCALREWLDELLWEEERGPGRPDVLRVKALLWVAGSARKHICQGVHDIYDVVEGPAWAPGERRYSKLVFIGRRLRRTALEERLAACLAGGSAGEDAL